MALARKGSRRITVDGVPYAWVLSPNDGFMVLVAEAADGSGQRVEAFFNYHDVYEPTEGGGRRVVGQRRSVSPGVVRRVILAALRSGWQPAARGLRPFRIQDADQLFPVENESA